MKLLSRSVFLLFGATLIWSGSVAAQDEQLTGMVEVFSCSYIDDNGMDELQAVADRWNDWADDHDVTDYTALIMSPLIRSDEMTYDVLWYGAYPSGNAMGAGLGQWLREGGELNEAFGEVVDCASTSLFAEAITREFTGETPELGVAAFQNCTIDEGRNIGETLAAAGRWGEYVAANGPVTYMAQLYPFGGLRPDSDYSFKAIVGFESPEGFGEFMHMLTSNGFAGANAFQGILAPYIDCDSARIYAVDFVRVPSGG